MSGFWQCFLQKMNKNDRVRVSNYETSLFLFVKKEKEDMKNNFGKDIICESEGKICYTKREAGNAINEAKKHHYSGESNSAKKIPVRKYFCKKCGFYHLTSHKSGKSRCSKRDYDLKCNKIKAFEYKKLWREEYSLLFAS